MTEDEIVGWPHQLNGHEFEQAPGVGDGQRNLAGCSTWGHKESDMTQGLNTTSFKCGLHPHTSLAFTISWSFLRLMSIQSVMLSNHLILCCPLLLLPSIFPSIRVFSNEQAVHIRWPKYWSFSFSICPSNEYSGLISFKISWFDLLAVQGSLKSLLQHRSLKASILQRSAFFMVQMNWQGGQPFHQGWLNTILPIRAPQQAVLGRREGVTFPKP